MTRGPVLSPVEGYTLIELMVAVALLGIVVGIAGGVVSAQRERAAEIVLRERAQQVLEYEAQALLERKSADPQARARMLADLPGGQLEARPMAPDGTVLSVTWRAPGGRAGRRELAVVGRGR